MAKKHTGFFYGSSTVKEFQEVYIFEAIVDLFSYITLVKRGLVPQPSMNACYIATNGVSRAYILIERAAYDGAAISVKGGQALNYE